MSVTRLLAIDDVPVLAELYRANRDFLAPWEPLRPEDYYTVDGQRALVEGALARLDAGMAHPRVILNEAGQVAGRINLSDIVRGPFQSASLGYWVSEKENGRGLATAAVRETVAVALGELGLHRVQAGTLLHNAGSQRVLERNGFTRIGVAPAYLNIAGRWQDHILFQVVAAD
ncbi:MAG: GNAT family N-acetyltransferase [Streptosporangiaceae bacterium]